jgi:NADH-quinone oxidoreductase subunit J
MLLGVDRAENLRTEPLASQRWLAGATGLGMLAFLTFAALSGEDEVVQRGSGIASAVAEGDANANIRQLATSIFSDYVVAFEATSVLLVVAVVGTVLLARRKKSVIEDRS